MLTGIAQRNLDPTYPEAARKHRSRSEEMQAIKNFVSGLSAFQVGEISEIWLFNGKGQTDTVLLQAWVASEPERPNAGTEAELGEAVHATRQI